MVTAFISYSHRDEEFRDELEIHLAMLKREGLIAVWHDRRIIAGTELHGTIKAELDSAQLILLLVSPYFLASGYCYEQELARALEMHRSGEARVIPIIVNPCEWQRAPFGDLRATPPDGRPITKFPNPHDAYLAIVQDIRAVLEEFDLLSLQNGAAPPEVTVTSPSRDEIPRSSNLRISKSFTDHEEDVFIDRSFEYVANFFEATLTELQKRHSEIQSRYRRIDANHFSASIYHQGKKAAACRVWVGGAHSKGILYSSNDRTDDSSYNECLSVTNDGQMLMLSPTMSPLVSHGGRDQLSQRGAAEYLWEEFISPLQ